MSDYEKLMLMPVTNQVSEFRRAALDSIARLQSRVAELEKELN